MTNPGDSDEWWKQYGGEGVTPETPPAAPQQPAPPQPSVPQQPVPPPAGYTSAPQYQNPPMTPPPQPVYPNYPPPQANPVPGYPVAGQPQVGGMQPQMGGMQPPGYGYPGYQPYGYAPVQQNNPLAIASLVISIIGLPTLFFCLFIPVISIVGLVLGIVSLNQMKTSQQQGRGLALGGIWVGAVGTVIGFALLLVLIIAGNWNTY
ncbi:DUF4190 domain-containing protein [Nocardia seriolae]|uniref:DUF4190 domain-containing protein n=1 Tax=Nocardia seriolae TaxID=37332 RepID=A0ABC8AKV4_9NOCA|nr:DUF4190 domain-containing protein [Nocardia seriolae]APA94963.1 hypothetical protein NS506_00888 [Nocardia seriolae]MTJ60250.1 DUF4190 domain-containing protein [Nocardia seriolae]MTJ75622.1 DUF4190 domain-containing protein [Nocardia seriolae]MTJ85244.1 DUF4190 domain-containing protein [Nocardia seriolae]MTK29239.1 DUF4190 domain-containing protein [Nocardia seriolae]